MLAAAERRIGLADRLARLIADPRTPRRVTHGVADILRARMLAIACGYEDADDLDHLRRDPGFKLACGRLPDTGRDLCSQPTISRWENAPMIRRIRSHWPNTRLTMRGDGHYGRPEVMAWCEAHDVDYIFGLAGNSVLHRLLEPAADDIRVRRAETRAQSLRGHAEIRYGAKSWKQQRRGAARIEATTLGLDIRCVVTSLRGGNAEWLYDALYCARGQAENLIKLHKGQLASDRTSCRSPLANQVRLVLHTAAYWLMLTLRDAIPAPQPLASAEFTTLRNRLLKIAGRILETATRVRIAFAAACPEAALFRSLAISMQAAGP
ncbi:hypothetical protein GCM10023158_19780 [Gluconacetobacter tumulicola]